MDSGRDAQRNRRFMADALDEAAAAGANVACFPEGANCIRAQGDASAAEPLDGGPTVELLKQKARKTGLFIHGGSFLERIEGDRRAYNTACIVAPDGNVIAQYRKMHPFDVMLPDGTCCRESDRVKPGSQVSVVDTPFGRWGTAICYDMRFPELFRSMALAGAQVIFVPANFTRQTGRDHWEVLLRARAIENGCYVVATNQCGVKPDFEAFGTSLVVDPWGDVLARASGETPEIVYATLDPARMQDVRARIPSLSNRRPDVYGSLTPEMPDGA